MDWDRVIERNREALKRVLASLVAMAGLTGGAAFTSPLWGGRREASGGGGDPEITPTRRSDDRRPPHKGEVNPGRPTLPRHLHRAVLRLLRPAEAAARRLVIVAARDLVVALPPALPRKPAPKPMAPVLRSLGLAVFHSPADAARAAASARRVRAVRKVTLPLSDPIRIPQLLSLSKGRPRSVPAHAAPRILSFNGARPHRLPPPPSPDDLMTPRAWPCASKR